MNTLTLANIELSFTENDLKLTKKWWKKQRYSEESDEYILLSAALKGIVTADIEN